MSFRTRYEEKSYTICKSVSILYKISLSPHHLFLPLLNRNDNFLLLKIVYTQQLYSWGLRLKKLFVILNDSEGSILHHASSPCKVCE
jgi:hypothetical protein